LRFSNTELGHIVHIVDADDASDFPLLALGIDDDCLTGALERREAADGLSIRSCEEAIAAGD
jgi:hypothetical protein